MDPLAPLDGIVNLHKPLGLTSAHALDRVRRVTGQRKRGHAGSLAPAAEGVLVLCLGTATKLVESMMDQPKVYRATARLDLTSAGHDSEKETYPVEVAAPPDEERVAHVLRGFEGTIEQVPPALSAVKVRGKSAYKLTRVGKPPTLAPRPITIYWLHLRRYAWPEVEFEVACGRGTYIRALIRDIGERLATGGCLTSLLRLAVGPFTLDQSWTQERIAAARPEDYMIPVPQAREMLALERLAIPPRPEDGTL